MVNIKKKTYNNIIIYFKAGKPDHEISNITGVAEITINKLRNDWVFISEKLDLFEKLLCSKNQEQINNFILENIEVPEILTRLIKYYNKTKYIKRENVEKALINGDFSQIQIMLIKIFHYQKNYKLAVDICLKLIDHPDIKIMLIKIYINMAKYKEAKDLCLQDIDNLEIKLLLISLYINSGKYGAAKEVCLSSVNESIKIKNKLEKINEYLEKKKILDNDYSKIKEFISKNKLNEAEKLCLKYPLNSKIIYTLADIYISQKRYLEAIYICTPILKLEKTKIKLIPLLIYYNRLEEAEQMCTDLPMQDQYILLRIEIYIKLNKLNKAKEYCYKLKDYNLKRDNIIIINNYKDAKNNLVAINAKIKKLIAMKNYKLAETIALKYQVFSKPKYLLAKIYMLQNRFEEAENLCITNYNTEYFKELLVRVFIVQGKYREAESTCMYHIENRTMRALLIDLYIKNREFKKAEEFCYQNEKLLLPKKLMHINSIVTSKENTVDKVETEVEHIEVIDENFKESCFELFNKVYNNSIEHQEFFDFMNGTKGNLNLLINGLGLKANLLVSNPSFIKNLLIIKKSLDKNSYEFKIIKSIISILESKSQLLDKGLFNSLLETILKLEYSTKECKNNHEFTMKKTIN